MYIHSVYLRNIEEYKIMKMQSEIKQWGNSLGLRIAGAVRDIPNFEAGTKVDIEIFDDHIAVFKSEPKNVIFPYSEDELIDSISDSDYSDILANPISSEWDI